MQTIIVQPSPKINITANTVYKELKLRATPETELPTEILNLWAERSAFLSEMKRLGKSPEQYAEFLKENRPNEEDHHSASTLRRWRKMKAFDERNGTRTLGGQRRPGRPSEISDIVLLLCMPGWLKRRTKASTVHYEKVEQYCKERQLKMVSYATYRRWATLFDQDFLERNIMKHGDWYAKNAPTIFQPDGNSNDVWIADACELGVWVFDGKNTFKPNIVVIIDKKSRLVMGWMISKFAIRTEDTVGCLKMAIMPKRNRATTWCGKPRALQLDKGGPFKSAQFLANLARLGIEPDYCYPECPQEKGRIERFFGTLGERFVKSFEDKIKGLQIPDEEGEDIQAGRAQAWWDRVVSQLDDYMADYCVSRVHSAHNKTPYESWYEGLEDSSLVNLDYKEVLGKIYVEKELTATKAGVEILPGQFWINKNFVGLKFGEDKLTVQLPPDGVDKGPVRAFHGFRDLGVIERNGEQAILAPTIKAVFKTREGDIKDMNQALKGFFERTAKYLGDLVGGEPEPVKSSRKKSPRKRSRSSKPEGIVATTVVVGDVK
jgi:putative transposase